MRYDIYTGVVVRDYEGECCQFIPATIAVDYNAGEKVRNEVISKIKFLTENSIERDYEGYDTTPSSRGWENSICPLDGDMEKLPWTQENKIQLIERRYYSSDENDLYHSAKILKSTVVLIKESKSEMIEFIEKKQNAKIEADAFCINDNNLRVKDILWGNFIRAISPYDYDDRYYNLPLIKNLSRNCSVLLKYENKNMMNTFRAAMGAFYENDNLDRAILDSFIEKSEDFKEQAKYRQPQFGLFTERFIFEDYLPNIRLQDHDEGACISTTIKAIPLVTYYKDR